MTKPKPKKGIEKCPPLSVRNTPEEREELRLQAGRKSLSDHVRSKLFDDGATAALAPTGRISDKHRQKLLAQILIRLGESNTAQNLNDLTKAIQSGLVDSDDELIDTMNTLRSELKALRHDLLKALGLRP